MNTPGLHAHAPTSAASAQGDGMSELVLSLFPGIGLLDMAFEEQDFCVVRGPDIIFNSLSDIKQFHPPAGRFDGVIGGPPCQAFSQLVHMVRANGYTVAENLIPEYERCVSEAQPAWFLMENVKAAPIPVVPGYAMTSFLLNNRWVGGIQERVRRFSFGVRGPVGVSLEPYLDLVALEESERVTAICAGNWRPTPVKMNAGGKLKSTAARNEGVTTKSALEMALRAQGLPRDFFGEDSPFTTRGKQHMLGNGVPLPMGRAIAKAIRAALQAQEAA